MSKSQHIESSGQALFVPWSAGWVFLQSFCLYLFISIIGRWAHYHRRTPRICSVGFWPIPYVGSWVAAVKFMLDPVGLVKEGVTKTENGLFRIATLSDEFVVVTDREKVAEYVKAPDAVLNMQDGANEQQQISFTMGYGVAHRTYHNIVVRKRITPSLPRFTSVMTGEIEFSFQAMIGNPKVYTAISLYKTIAMTVARVSSRVFVDGEYCRDQAYLQNATDYAQAVVLSAEVLRLFPRWAKGIIVKFLPVTSCMRKAVEFLGKDVQDRLNGRFKGNEKPDDLIQWLIDAAPPIERTAYQIVERVMALNVASIHTTTMTFTPAIYRLAAEPTRYLNILRKEVIDNLQEGQITYNTTQKLRYMDSFLRESARMSSSGLAAIQRNARQQFVFSDGTIIPKGAKLVTPSLIMQRDAAAIEDPDLFDGFRYVHYLDGACVLEKTMVTTGTDYHLFGHGRHPCPGRHFASHEMKLMFAVLLLNYDVCLAPGTKSREFYIATMCMPDTTVEILFKIRSNKRQ